MYSTSQWDPHLFYYKDREMDYEVLAKSVHGPCIIEQGLAIGTSFHISYKYPATVTILENYLCKYLTEIQVNLL